MKKYTLAHNTIDDNDYKLMIDFLKKRKTLTQSKVTKSFEKKFSTYLGYKYSAFVNSGSSANLLIAQSLLEGKYLKNKIAILPAVSWSTTVSPYLQLGYKVILCDCDKENLGLDINHLKKLCLKYKPGLLVLVNVLGHSNDYQNILSATRSEKINNIINHIDTFREFINHLLIILLHHIIIFVLDYYLRLLILLV